METLIRNVLTASFHGSLVILAILLLRPLLKKGPKKFLCLLWLLAFIRLVLPFEIQSSLSLQPKTHILPEVSQEQPYERPELQKPILPQQSVTHVPKEAPLPQENAPELPAEEPQIEPVPVEKHISLLAVSGWIWLGTVSLFVAFSVYSYTRLRLAVRDAIRIRGAWESEHIETAFILGFIRPKIYIPMGMDFQTRRYILAHERTHLEKGDQWLKLFGYLTLALHWFNPLVWVAYILLCKDIELACDERVVQFMDLPERKAYSSALLACSANHIHLAACPVAFGEVSVKERIKAVLHYKKPAFWISLICVAAIVFVVVCLMTSPAKETSQPVDATVPTETSPNLETKPASKDGPVANLSVSEIQYTCQQAVQELMDRESYYILGEYSSETEDSEYKSGVSQTEYRRYGNNYMDLSIPNEEINWVDGFLQYEGRCATYYGDGWVVDENREEVNPNRILENVNPQNMTVTFPEGTGVVDGHTLSFHAEWTNQFAPEITYSGIITYQFNEDGTLQKMTQDYSFQRPEGEKTHVNSSLTVMEEATEVTKEKFKEATDTIITQEELDTVRVRDQQVTEIPSNKTNYDKDFALGAGEMGWQMMDGAWFLKFGSRNATPVSTDLYFEFSEDYDNSGITGSVVTAKEFFIETLENDKWVEYPLAQEGKNTMQAQNVAAGSTIHIDWEDSYGSLPAGFYRVGMYYTLTTGSGETDTQFCYAKFRLYDPDMKKNLETCRSGLKALLAQENYHLTDHSTHYGGGRDGDFIMHEDVWKHGNDYLSLVSSYMLEDNSLRFVNGSGRLNGSGYTLEFEDNDFTKLKERKTADFVVVENMELWTFDYEIYDSKVLDVTRNGNKITVRSDYDFDDRFSYIDTVYHFDGEGKLCKMQKISVTPDGKKTVDGEMTVHKDSPEKIARRIQDMNSGKTPSFSYQKDMEELEKLEEGVRTKNFVNSSPASIKDAQAAIERAKNDCTLSAEAGLEPGANMYQAFYDEQAHMWKVEFTASWDSTIYQAVYMDDQGVTKLTVARELPAEY